MPVSPTFQQERVVSKYSWTSLQLTATLGTEESGHSREVAIAEMLKQQWMLWTVRQEKWLLQRGGRYWRFDGRNSINYSRISTNGHLSTTAIFFFGGGGGGGQSIRSLLFQSMVYTLFCPTKVVIVERFNCIIWIFKSILYRYYKGQLKLTFSIPSVRSSPVLSAFFFLSVFFQGILL